MSSTFPSLDGMNSAFSFSFPYAQDGSFSMPLHNDQTPQDYGSSAPARFSFASLPGAVEGSLTGSSNGTISPETLDPRLTSETTSGTPEEYPTLDHFPILGPQDVLDRHFSSGNGSGTTSLFSVTSGAVVDPFNSDGTFVPFDTNFGATDAGAEVETYDDEAVQSGAPMDTRSVDPGVTFVPESSPSTQLVDEESLALLLDVLKTFVDNPVPEGDVQSLPVDAIGSEEISGEVSENENKDPLTHVVSESKGTEVLGAPQTIAPPDAVLGNAPQNIDDDLLAKSIGAVLDDATYADILEIFRASPGNGTHSEDAQAPFHAEELCSSMAENGVSAQAEFLHGSVSQDVLPPTYSGVVGAYPNNPYTEMPSGLTLQLMLQQYPQSLGNTYYGPDGAPVTYVDPRYIAAPNVNGIPYPNGMIPGYDVPIASSSNVMDYSHLQAGQLQPISIGYISPTPSLSSSSGSRDSSTLPSPLESESSSGSSVGRKRRRSRSDSGQSEHSQASSSPQPAENSSIQGVVSFDPDAQPGILVEQEPPKKKRRTNQRKNAADLLTSEDFDVIIWIAKYKPTIKRGVRIQCPKCKHYGTDLMVVRHVTSHSQLYQIYCPCGKKFCRLDSYKRHADNPSTFHCTYWRGFVEWEEAAFGAKVSKIVDAYAVNEERAHELKQLAIEFRLACQRLNRCLASMLEGPEEDQIQVRPEDWLVVSSALDECWDESVVGVKEALREVLGLTI